MISKLEEGDSEGWEGGEMGRKSEKGVAIRLGQSGPQVAVLGFNRLPQTV